MKNKSPFFAAFIAGVCLCASITYLSYYMYLTQKSVNELVGQLKLGSLTPSMYSVSIGASMYIANLGLVATGIFIAMAFAFLGFSLYLLGIKDRLDSEITNNLFKAKINQISIGAFIIVCSMILIAFCIYEKPQLQQNITGYEFPTTPKSNENSNGTVKSSGHSTTATSPNDKSIINNSKNNAFDSDWKRRHPHKASIK